MAGASYRIATVWGIPIRLHISLLVLVAYVSLRAMFTGGPLGILLALVGAVCVFTSIALHELGHSFVARRKGCKVRDITLMFIGGAAQMERIPSRPMDEFQMAIAGPLVSLMLGMALFFGGGQLGTAWPLAGALVTLIGKFNFWIAGFNLIPAFPMDGGRVLRALLTPRKGRLRATFIAARIGRILAIVGGIYGFMHRPILWFLVVIAFFIYAAAGREYDLVAMQDRARRMGFAPPDGDEEEDLVTISPPPYAKGPVSKTRVHPADNNPFRNRFPS